MYLTSWLSHLCFRAVHEHNLVYNACWEDPRLDRAALNLGSDDTIAVITSAGCNCLDYALLGPRQVHAVDMNYRQNALLELKIAGIRELDFDDFFALFGHGYHRGAAVLYRQRLRRAISPPARAYWDRRIGWFASPRGSFYFHGTSGMLAWVVNHYIDYVARMRSQVRRLLDSRSLAEQQSVYTRAVHEAFWKGLVRWVANRDATLALLGVPRAQRQQVEGGYPGGIAQFIEDRITAVFTRLPLHENYFWRVYLSGHYTQGCCPEYLKRENFLRLKDGLVERIRPSTASLLQFLRSNTAPISRFVLLDHMDWLSTLRRPLLAEQWQALVDTAAPRTRLLWRSGALHVGYVDPIQVDVRGRRHRLGELLTYNRVLAQRLHQHDRVNTYGSFYIADLSAN
jgi:S-adenosylmethionine-diacylglycerol 3-amino-3-carboxypropyl transferase